MWLNGYSGHRITDMELKKLVAMHGGNVRQVFDIQSRMTSAF